MKEIIIAIVTIIEAIVNNVLYGVSNEEKILRKAQGMLYRKMEQNHTPIYGWNQFWMFVDSINKGRSFDEAYAKATEEPASFRVKILEGDGSTENPWILG